MFPFRKIIIREATKSLVKQVRVCGRSTSSKPCVIQAGDCLPHCDLYEEFPTNAIQMSAFAKLKNLVIFGVPGAFSPSCSKTHLPSYLEAASSMKKNGIDEIVCIAVNDAYVMGAWAKHHKTKGKIRMFADPAGCFTFATGLGMNCATLGGFRAMRFAMVVVNNIVQNIHIEPDGVSLCCTLADDLCYKQYIKDIKS